jgi:plastocyanin domain-containing protein
MKSIVLAIGIVIILVLGTIIFTRITSNPNDLLANVNNVSVVDGTQIIEITAKGGYAPQVTIAKADMPTIIRVDTKGTFDCSSSLTIPTIGYRGNLPITGTIDIPIPSQTAGTELQGLCGMGMYNFLITFN